MKKGEKIMPMLAAGNYDPQANEHPEKLDLARTPNRRVAVSAGIHFCLGHQLARIKGKCALHALFERWPKLERDRIRAFAGAREQVSGLSSDCRS